MEGALANTETVSVRSGWPDEVGVPELLADLDRYLLGLYPVESNHIDDIGELSRPNVLFAVAELEGVIVGCGAVKLLHDALTGGDYGEIKRVFVAQAARGNGVSHRIMDWLEASAAQQGAQSVRLETGGEQPEALTLYKARGYHQRKVFGSYASGSIALSLFMEKTLG